MLTLYTWTTPNGKKVPILLEELGLAYDLRWVNIGNDEQFAPDFLQIAPNNKIPALVDHDAEGGPLSIFESGAILTYLAEKHGRFLATQGAERYKALEWLAWQVGGLGPMLGQLNYFAKRAKEAVPPAIERFAEEGDRLMQVIERRLAEVPYLAGSDYSIADIACYPWMVVAAEALAEIIAIRPATQDWMARIAERPAVATGMAIKPS